jgi:hypothetical protein
MIRIQPGIEFPIIPEDFIETEEDAHPGELHPLGERQFPICLKDTENDRLSYKGKYSGWPRFSSKSVE